MFDMFSTLTLISINLCYIDSWENARRYYCRENNNTFRVKQDIERLPKGIQNENFMPSYHLIKFLLLC